MLQGSNSFFETPKPQFVSSCVQVLDVDSENVKAPRISRNFSVQEKDVMLGENLPKKKLSMIGVMIVMIGVIYLFNDLWWVNQINDYMLISLISLRDGLGRCLFFQICFLWNVVDMVPDMDGYRSTLFRIPRPRIGSMELPNTIFSGKNMRKTLFPTDYPWKQQVGQFETQVTGELIPWVLGCGTWICQVVNHLPTFRFFFIRSWQALVSFDQSFFGLFFFVWPVWRGSHALKTLQRASTEGSDCLLRKTVETYFPENLKRLTFQSRDFGSTWYGIYIYIYICIYTYVYDIVYVLGYPTKKSNSLESLQYGAFNL